MAPERVEINGVDDYLAELTKVVFQSGMGRQVVEAKWDGFLEAFEQFDCTKVAALSPEDVDRLVADTRVIRNRRKIEATVHNAETLLELEERGGFATWLRGHESDTEREKALRKEFKFLGPSGIHQFLWAVGESEGVCERMGA